MTMYVDSYHAITAKDINKVFKEVGYNEESIHTIKMNAQWDDENIRIKAINGNLLIFKYIASYNRCSAKIEKRVGIVWTPCRYGGKRPYFICPHCLRKTYTLRITINGPVCRSCIQAGYKSQSKDELDIAWQQAHKAKSKTSNGKPKGMHWKTFDKMLDKTATLIEHAEEIGSEHFMRTYYKLMLKHHETLQRLMP